MKLLKGWCCIGTLGERLGDSEGRDVNSDDDMMVDTSEKMDIVMWIA